MTKAKSGGGITSNKNVRPPMKTGSPRANKISPGAADRIGQQVVMTTSQGTKLVQGTAPQAPLGNALARTSAKADPGLAAPFTRLVRSLPRLRFHRSPARRVGLGKATNHVEE